MSSVRACPPAAATALAAILAGCSSGDDRGAQARTPPPPAPEPSAVRAERIGTAGGNVTSSDDRLTLEFPSGALPAENEITIETLDPDDLPSQFQGVAADFAYDLGPDGLAFDAPVTVVFDVGNDPVLDDGTIAMGLHQLLTSENGRAALLDGVTTDIDPETGLTRVSGTIEHFSPLATSIYGFPSLLDSGGVKADPPDELDEGQRTTVEVTVEPPETVRGMPLRAELVDALYSDLSSSPLSSESVEDTDDSPLTFDGDRYVGQFDYSCSGSGTGTYAATVELEGTFPETDEMFSLAVRLRRAVACNALPEPPDGGGTEPQSRLIEAPPGAGQVLALPSGTEFLDDDGAMFDPVAAVVGLETVWLYDEQLEVRLHAADPGLSGQLFAIDVVPEGYVAISGENGMKMGLSGTIDTFSFANVTDVDFFSADQVAGADYTNGSVFFATNDALSGWEFDMAISEHGARNEDLVGSGQTILSIQGGYRWADENDLHLVLTAGFDEVDGERIPLPGTVQMAAKPADGSFGTAAMTKLHDLDAGANRLRCAAPDAEGDTVCIATATGTPEDPGDALLLAFNYLTGESDMIAEIEDRPSITPAVRRFGDYFMVAVADESRNELWYGAVSAELELQTATLPAPDGCEGLAHAAWIDDSWLLGTCTDSVELLDTRALDENFSFR